MKDDVISRVAAADIVRFECGEWRGLAKTIIDEFEALPTVDAVPCDVCRFAPPSSGDGKPCTICPAEGKDDDNG